MYARIHLEDASYIKIRRKALKESLNIYSQLDHGK